MGEAGRNALRVCFDRTVKLEFHGATVSSDAGLLPYRDLDDAVRLTESAAADLLDLRTDRNIRHGMTALLRQSTYSRLAGYENVNNGDRLGVDPVMRQVVGGRAVTQDAASTSQVGRSETEVLGHPNNLATLTAMPGAWVDRVRQRRPMKTLILDLDSSVSETYGDQEGSAYNGHFGCECYHPLFCFNQFGDVERALLRNGNVASADDWRSVLEPVIARYRGLDIRRFFRGDAAFAIPDLYEALEAEGHLYAIRLKGNAVLHRRIEHLLTRPVGRPSNKLERFYQSFEFQAKSWGHPRRLVAKVEWHRGELFPRVGFIVTNLRRSARQVVKFYNGRGMAEQWIKEGKNAVQWTRLSCRRFDDNQARLQLFALAYNLGNFLRRLALPRAVKHWSLTTLRRESDQDRSEGGAPRTLCHIPTGRGGRAAFALRGHPGAGPAVRGGRPEGWTGMRAWSARRPGQRREASDVGAPRACVRTPFGPLDQSVCSRYRRSCRRLHRRAVRSGLCSARAAVCWWRTARRRRRAKVKWEMSAKGFGHSEEASFV